MTFHLISDSNQIPFAVLKVDAEDAISLLRAKIEFACCARFKSGAHIETFEHNPKYGSYSGHVWTETAFEKFYLQPIKMY